MEVALIPASKVHFKNHIFDEVSTISNEDKNVFLYLKDKAKEYGININTIDLVEDIGSLEAVFFLSNLNYLWLNKCLKEGLKSKMAYIAWEPPVVMPWNSKDRLNELLRYFEIIMTWNPEIIDNDKIRHLRYPHDLCSKHFEKSFDSKKLLVNISANKFSPVKYELYSKRREVINYFEQQNNLDFDFYGFGWKKTLKNYGGSVVSKYETYSNYKFALCFENMCNIEGYVTEKIFDCFTTPIVPVYWGASNISQEVSKKCYINYGSFNGISDMHEYLKSMSNNEYNEYIWNINEFLNSENSKKYSFEVFFEKINEVILNLAKNSKNPKINPIPVLKNHFEKTYLWTYSMYNKYGIL
ncbi:hypothetical protein HNP93_000644 [Methanococcus maripaludis]|uniref:Fucosyltransferase C-terminal domain-containing protein n=1 Tax=Methanococcus maripaludis TaxID=39152 RepID=A0A7J9P408_METMI|nr:glycosyltransferase family 10 [Methanococcus maripaludis]MBA2857943.1 hypothetical protein [Methanococcus maripaludis]